ncbi:hypothetical protein G7061_01455 [Erysipelothrix sp. HDW6B]|uniref:hypothetical protein n=1 Tax=Erysipelothrix TaxID=1647 RepID=UPI00135B4619|nr:MULTISPECIES: hypothetical protein [Erysipelothrix]QIK85363.1 hypothetical protein G7061_01455 [Erysipelothrix sp. HDW6B]
MAQKSKDKSTYTSIVGLGILVTLMWISDRILYPFGGWPMLRIINYVLMIAAVVLIIQKFIKLTKQANK